MVSPPKAFRPSSIEHIDVTAQALQKRTLIVLIITQVVGAVGVGVAPSIGILLAGEVMHNEAWAGLARTTSTLGAALFGMPLGTLAAQRGRRIALATGWWVAGLGAAILVVAAQWNLAVPLFVGLLLIGAGSAASLQGRFAATDLATPGKKARALALIVWVGTLGSVLGPNLGAPGAIVARSTGLTIYAAAFLIAAVFLLMAGTIVFSLLRPDPLLYIKDTEGPIETARTTVPESGKRRRFAAVAELLRGSQVARCAVLTILTGQVVMVAIMTMTPVHIVNQGGSIDLVGITISLHILGMFALAPLVGWITDKAGFATAIWIGIVILILSLVFGAVWPDDGGWILASLILLGVGWSFLNVAGSALFTVAVPAEGRAASQGGMDALSNLFGATAAFVAGPLLAVSSFAFLCVLGLAALVPLIVRLLRVGRLDPTVSA